MASIGTAATARGITVETWTATDNTTPIRDLLRDSDYTRSVYSIIFKLYLNGIYYNVLIIYPFGYILSS